MVYHFEAQKFLHVCIPQRARGRKRGREGEHKAKEQRDREEKKGRREGVQREDLSHKVEQQKHGREMETERERQRKPFLHFFIILSAVSDPFSRLFHT